MGSYAKLAKMGAIANSLDTCIGFQPASRGVKKRRKAGEAGACGACGVSEVDFKLNFVAVEQRKGDRDGVGRGLRAEQLRSFQGCTMGL